MEAETKQLLEPPIWCDYPKDLGCYLLYNKENITESDCIGCDAYDKLKNK